LKLRALRFFVQLKIKCHNYPLNIGGGHEGLEDVEMVIHLPSPVAFYGNVGHALALYFFLVLGRPWPLALSSFPAGYW